MPFNVQSMNSNQVLPERWSVFKLRVKCEMVFPLVFHSKSPCGDTEQCLTFSNYISQSSLQLLTCLLLVEAVLGRKPLFPRCLRPAPYPWSSNELHSVRPITSLMGSIAFLSSPCNFQQGPLTHLMGNICACLICLSPTMGLMAGVELPASIGSIVR